MKSILALLVTLSPAFAFAVPTVKSEIAKIEAETDKCLANPDNQSTIGTKICLGDGFEAADKVMNGLYKETVVSLKKKTGDADSDQWNAEILRRLVKSQRAWVTFRDAQADLNATDMLGGSGEGMIYIGTIYDMTTKRTLELNEMFSESNR